MKTKKRLNSTYLVAEYLVKNKKKAYIHDMKRVCKANNIGQRVMYLRRLGWEILTILERYENGIAIYHYKLIKSKEMPKQYV